MYKPTKIARYVKQSGLIQVYADPTGFMTDYLILLVYKHDLLMMN